MENVVINAYEKGYIEPYDEIEKEEKNKKNNN